MGNATWSWTGNILKIFLQVPAKSGKSETVTTVTTVTLSTLSEVIKFLHNFFIIILLMLAIFSLFWLIWRLIEPLDPPEVLIRFYDLRESGMSNDINEDSRRLRDLTITQLFAATLQSTVSIHEVAYQHCLTQFKQHEISNSETNNDTVSLSSEIDVTHIFMEDPLQLSSIGISDNLGTISTASGPFTANISLDELKRFLKFRRKESTIITGSLQNIDKKIHLVAQLSSYNKSWAWVLDETDCPQQNESSNEKLRALVEELSYRTANRLIGQNSTLFEVLPGKHFEQYTKLLSLFSDYLRFLSEAKTGSEDKKRTLEVDKEQKHIKLHQCLYQFQKAEPHDIRAYYILYKLGILCILDQKYDDALELYLDPANQIETYVVEAILNTGINTKELNWNAKIIVDLQKQLAKHYKFLTGHYTKQNKILRTRDRKKARELSIIIASVNAARGFALTNSKKENIDQETQIWTNLVEAAKSYHKASIYQPNEPIYLSLEAEVYIKLSDQLQPKDDLLLKRIFYRQQGEKLLINACRLRRNNNRKYALNRLGRFKIFQGDIRSAIVYFNQALENDRNFAIAWRNLALAYIRIGEHDLAINKCDEAEFNILTSSTTMHGWIQNTRGWAFLQKARERRISNSHKSPRTTIEDTDIKTWLIQAEHEFKAATLSLKEKYQIIPEMNLLYTNLSGATNCNDICVVKAWNYLEAGINKLRDLESLNIFASIYYNALIDSKSLRSSYSDFWKQGKISHFEYLGILTDLLLLLEIIDTISPRRDKLIGQNNSDDISLSDMNFDQIRENIENAIKIMEPLFCIHFMSVTYLWYGFKRHALDCWRNRIDELQNSSPTNCYCTFSELNSSLSIYLYRGLISIFAESNTVEWPESNEVTLVFTKAFENKKKNPEIYKYSNSLLAEANIIYKTLVRNGPSIINKHERSMLKKLIKPLERFMHA